MFENPDADLAAAEAAYAEHDFGVALASARLAIDGWDDAQERGLQRLAIGAAIISALTFSVWWLVRRLSRGRDSVARTDRHQL